MNRHHYSTTDFDAAPARKRAESPAMEKACAALKEQAHKTAMWLVANGDRNLTLPAERIVEDCLRVLQAIPPTERVGADDLMDGISLAYLGAARDRSEARRRCWALLRLSPENEAPSHGRLFTAHHKLQAAIDKAAPYA